MKADSKKFFIITDYQTRTLEYSFTNQGTPILFISKESAEAAINDMIVPDKQNKYVAVEVVLTIRKK